MSNQFSLYNRPAARRLIITLVIIKLMLIGTGYGLLWWYASQQQQQFGKNFLVDIIQKFNRKIDAHEYDWSNLDVNGQHVIENYQLMIIEPSGHTTIVNNNALFNSLPNWSLSTHTSDKIFYQIDGFEVWHNLNHGYRLYVKAKYFSIWRNFANPIYLVPFLLGLCLFLYEMVQLRKSYETWYKFLAQAQNMPLQIQQDYQPAKFYEFYRHPELMYLVQLFNRYTYKLTQYHNKIRELNYRQNILIDTSPILLFTMSRTGRILYFNHTFSQIFYTAFQPGVIYMLSDFITGADKTTQQLLNSLENIHTYVSLPVTNLQRDIYFDLRITPYYNRFGQLQGYSCGLQDTTAYHDKLQKAWVEDKYTAEKITSFNKMWAVLGHELRTPLTGLVGMIELLAEDQAQFSSEHQETIVTLQQSSQTMIQLLNDMLDVAKLEAGKLQTNVTSIDILKLLRQTTELMIGNARRQKISLYILVEPHTPRFIDGDEGKLRQILLNLLTNAVKFTKEGYVAITVDKTDSSHPLIAAKNNHNPNLPKDWLKIVVKDTGLGIIEKDQQALFSYFGQANDSISRQFGGTGLGLAISNNFSYLLGGFIHLESEYGKGSEFQLFLPIQKFSLQPVYQYKTSHLRVALIIISPFEIAQRMAKTLTYLELAHYIFTSIDNDVITTINRLDLQGLMPVLLIDDAALTYNSNLLSNLSNYDDAIKIILSIESNKTLPAEWLLQFDGYLQKPASLSSLIAEITHLYDLKVKKQANTNLPVQLAFKQFLQQYPALNHTKPAIATTSPPNVGQPGSLGQASQLTDSSANDCDNISTSTNSDQKLILLAEDNPVNQKIAKKYLSALGYQYLVASDGEQAVKLLSEHRQQIGLVLMDCRMPILDGIEATRIIRLNKDSVPIVALTANDGDEDRTLCLEAGMDSFLTKPISRQKLIEVINHYML